MSQPLTPDLPPDLEPGLESHMPLSAAAPVVAPKQANWLAAIMPVILIAACAELGISVLNNSALPVYFKQGLKIPGGTYGLLMIPFFISEVLFKSPLGVLADRFGRKPLMLGGAIITVFTPLIFITTKYDPLAATAVITLLVFGFLRALDGLGQAALWPSLYAYVGDVVEEKKRGTAMGALNVVYMVGLAISFLLGGFVDDTFGPVLAKSATFGEQMGVLRHRMGNGVHQMGSHLHGALHHAHGTLLHPAPAAPVPPPLPLPPPPHYNYQPEYYYPSFILASVLFGIAVIAALSVRGKVRRHHTHADQHAHDEAMTWEGFVAALKTVPQFLGLAFVTFLGIGCIALLVKWFALDEYHLSETEIRPSGSGTSACHRRYCRSFWVSGR